METKKKLKLISELVEIGLKYNVDYRYVLEDIEKVLDNVEVNVKVENYIDY